MLTLPLLGAAAFLTGIAATSDHLAVQSSNTEYTKLTKANAEEVTDTTVTTEQVSTEVSQLPEVTTEEITSEETIVEVPSEAVQTSEVISSQEAVSYTEPAVASSTVPQSTTVLANGNTAGETGSYAAAQMAAATGVSQSTWEYIIARESNGDSSVTNSSGASGLFQTMPGWGSTATVDDQIQSALNAYNAQGLSAWGY
ncbi:hypothetical protein JOC31_000642 [Streptococcus saliviloxodontae]|uniref:Transglycosylase SLT domain-containing protein n=2 Tax=Streptococcus saliviloxodontae TaxID=1349416 RepID=A0ABS2PK68_9STRE|nr:hypothetical protein [Streptococcus saliviloxodontae]